MNTNFLLKTAVNFASKATQFEFDYLFKAVDNPGWYWFFRIAFMLGVILSVTVYLYYRGEDR